MRCKPRIGLGWIRFGYRNSFFKKNCTENRLDKRFKSCFYQSTCQWYSSKLPKSVKNMSQVNIQRYPTYCFLYHAPDIFIQPKKLLEITFEKKRKLLWFHVYNWKGSTQCRIGYTLILQKNGVIDQQYQHISTGYKIHLTGLNPWNPLITRLLYKGDACRNHTTGGWGLSPKLVLARRYIEPNCNWDLLAAQYGGKYLQSNSGFIKQTSWYCVGLGPVP